MKAQGSYLDQATQENLNRAEQLSNNLTDLNQGIEGDRRQPSPSDRFFSVSLLRSSTCVCPDAEMIHDWELYSTQQEVDPEEVQRSSQLAQGMVAWMRMVDLSPLEPAATDESSESHDCKTQRKKTPAALKTFIHMPVLRRKLFVEELWG